MQSVREFERIPGRFSLSEKASTAFSDNEVPWPVGPMRTGASLRAKKSAGPRADGFFTLRSARGIFAGVHAAAENDFSPFAAEAAKLK